MTAKPLRDSNIELLRIVLMLMIIYHHFLVHGRGLELMSADTFHLTNHTVADAFIDSFLIMGVNCFVFISGYYGLKFRSRTILSLIFQAFTFSVLLYILYDWMFAGGINLKSILRGMLPISRGEWWFITTYFFLYLLSPLLNVAKKKLTKFQFLYILLILTIINFIAGYIFNASSLAVRGGYSLLSFISIYFYGQAFNEYFKLNKSAIFYLFTYLTCSLLIFLMFFVSLKYLNHSIAYKNFEYNNPLVMLSAIAFFSLFKSIKIPYLKTVNNISTAVLGIYLFHEQRRSIKLISENLNYISVNYNIVNVYFTLLVLAILVFVIGFIIEKLRAMATDPIIDYIINKFNLSKLDNLINL